MDIKELTEEMNRLVRSKGWYAEDSKRPQTPRNLAISLSLEAAEILEHFQWRDEVKDKEETGIRIGRRGIIFAATGLGDRSRSGKGNFG